MDYFWDGNNDNDRSNQNDEERNNHNINHNNIQIVEDEAAQSPTTTPTPSLLSSSSSSSHSHSPQQRRPFSLVDEISGSCGDFGTLLPLLVAMARLRVIHLAPTLFWSGICHIVTGYFFQIPMPLQPMKAISSLAIAGELTQQQVSIAGIGMGVCFLVLGSGVGNFVEMLNRWIPTSVISGLQLGVGWKLALKGIQMIQDLESWWFSTTNLDCITLAIMCSILCLYGLSRNKRTEQQRQQQLSTADDLTTTRTRTSSTSCQPLIDRPPVGIYLFMIGVVAAVVQLLANPSSSGDGDDSSSTTTTTIAEPLVVNALQNTTASDWREGILSGTLTQLPLTTLNSCLSVCLLAHTLFPSDDVRKRVSRQSVCLSIGIINTVMCPLGMMPTCHGAGGLAGQHRLGANTGVSMILLGVFKIGLGLLASRGSLLTILDALPASVLGVLLVLAGHELAATGVLNIAKSFACSSTARDDSVTNARTMTNSFPCKDDEMAVCLITALVVVGTGQAHIGVLSGWIACLIYRGRSTPYRRHTETDEGTRYAPLGQGLRPS